ncbi:hypothetical protein AWB76_00913 [Caballeronia temeraria]|uniref:Uncharacterized protein n=1 Tax=Caballeronia temeraria TaxID=1777137 RepID=A0A157ZLT4_9BURK|nr:hypothetical protein AWB76_00913 [Caballeronia temeraria]
MSEGESVFNVKVIAKLNKDGKSCTFEMQVLDDLQQDITDMFRFYARFEEEDIGNARIDAVIVKRKTI